MCEIEADDVYVGMYGIQIPLQYFHEIYMLDDSIVDAFGEH